MIIIFCLNGQVAPLMQFLGAQETLHRADVFATKKNYALNFSSAAAWPRYACDVNCKKNPDFYYTKAIQRIREISWNWMGKCAGNL